ncbi:MAG: toll/interleukin-1 receptor domain-containing protein, partial [Verrucomicrobia bacterium]|nr:toll/interleukin-1 receptor domain-containing protein [Verrucomicrobiota bacterium]
MSSPISTEPDLRKLLFISYAYEDQVFAKWLARKLAFYGYGVWFDQIQILGGESWVKEVDVAIKDRSFRVLGLLSKASIGKDNPRKERTLALQLGKQWKTDDFLVTLNLDGVQPDWTLSDISWISFRESWADGLRKLLKKLESLNAPRIHAGNTAIAKAALERGASLLSQKSEALTTNWMPFVQVPEALHVFDTSELSKEQEQACRDLWPHYGLKPGQAAAFSPPP